MKLNNCCTTIHIPLDTACQIYEEGMNGRCVYCDHENKCHPGPGATCEIGKDVPIIYKYGIISSGMYWCGYGGGPGDTNWCEDIKYAKYMTIEEATDFCKYNSDHKVVNLENK